jgi:xylose isomerase
VWDFAAGSMRTYLILKEKTAQFRADAEIQGLLAELRARGGSAPMRTQYSAASVEALRDESFDLTAMREHGYAYERLDQLTIELLMGVR